MPSKAPRGMKREECALNHRDGSLEPAPDAGAELSGTGARKIVERMLLHKVDIRMLILIPIYIPNHMDRNNATAARLRGFEEDLGLIGDQFATILGIFYVGYVIMQVPSNMYLNSLSKPSAYLAVCMVLWGLITALTGVAHSFVGVLLARLFLGICESVFFPGALFLLSKWYKRDEISLRVTLLLCGGFLSNVFGSLIASGILDRMEGVLGYAAWRWLFFIEGALTIFIALIVFLVLPDFPPTSRRWLPPIEAELALKRMEEEDGVGDRGQTEDGSQAQILIEALTDWKVLYMALNIACTCAPTPTHALFPTLAAALGYNRTVTLLLCAPPWMFAIIAAVVVTRHSDATGEKSLHVVGSLSVGLVGFVIASSTTNAIAQYISLFLVVESHVAIILLWVWICSMFPRRPSKRAVAIAVISGSATLGKALGSYIWPKKWGDSYRYSYAICIATNGLSIVMILGFRARLKALNEKAEREEREQDLPRGYRYLL